MSLSPLLPCISVVVPCHQGHVDLLAVCLTSLVPIVQQARGELIVVNSDDSDAVRLLVNKHEFVRHIYGGGCQSAAQARNIGVQDAYADYLAFIDADCIPSHQWLTEALLGLSEGNVAIGGPVGNILPLHPVATMDNLMQFVDQLKGRPEGLSNAFPGCNFAIDAQVFRQLGGFPEDMPIGEDTALTNLVALNWPAKTRFRPNMDVAHLGRTNMSEFLQHQYGFGFGRGLHCLHMTRQQQSLGRFYPIAFGAMLKRLCYFGKRSAQWNMMTLIKTIVFFPVLGLGLIAWSRGFCKGCQRAMTKVSK